MTVTIPGPAVPAAWIAMRDMPKKDDELDLHSELMPAVRRHMEDHEGIPKWGDLPALSLEMTRSQFRYLKGKATEFGQKFGWPEVLVDPRIALRGWIEMAEPGFNGNGKVDED